MGMPPPGLEGSRSKSPAVDAMSSGRRDRLTGTNREREELMKQLELERAEREKLIRLEQRR